MLFSSYHFVTVMMKTMTIKAKVKNSPILTWPMMSLRIFFNKIITFSTCCLHSSNRYSFVVVYIIQASEIEVHFPICDPPFPPKASSHSTFEKSNRLRRSNFLLVAFPLNAIYVMRYYLK